MKDYIYLEECESTNLFLANLLSEESPNLEHVVISDFQSAGKGQKHGFWESEKGKNLTFSYNLINLGLKAVNQFYISIIISLSIVDLLGKYLPAESIKIKWPNDVYIGDKKVAGILVENHVSGENIVSCNIGIGINANQLIFKSNAPNPVSIRNFCDHEIDTNILLIDYMYNFEKYLALLKNGEFESLKRMYLNKMYRINKIHKYSIDNKIIFATIRGVDTYGFLNMNIDGDSKSFDIKQVKYL